MRTRRRLLVLAAVLAGGLVGCGGGSGGGGPLGADADLVGRWAIFQRTTDGGQTWVKANSDFEFTFRSNGTWVDNKEGAGDWWTRGSFLTASTTVGPDKGTIEYWVFDTNQAVTQLVIIEADADGTERQEGTLYIRLE